MHDMRVIFKGLREAGIPALLYGPPGTGKTSLVEAAFPDLITIAGDGDTTVADFTGDYTQRPDGTYEFIYRPLIQAMTEGRALLIDDATLISPQVLAVAYPTIDGRREITVKGPAKARRSRPRQGSASAARSSTAARSASTAPSSLAARWISGVPSSPAKRLEASSMPAQPCPGTERSTSAGPTSVAARSTSAALRGQNRPGGLTRIIRCPE
jgi:hypothetical protein